MKQCWIKMLAFAMALVLTLSTVSLAMAEEIPAYGKVTRNQVYLRKQPSTKTDYWFRMNENHVAQILDLVERDGKIWYHVETTHPTDLEDEKPYVGYILGDFFVPLTDEELKAWLAGQSLGTENVTVPEQPQPQQEPVQQPVQETAQPQINVAASAQGSTIPADNVPVSNRFGEVSASGTNFRQTPSVNGQKIMVLERGVVVELTSIPSVVDANHWYGVRYEGLEGYIMATYIREMPDVNGEPVIHGYVKLVKSSANLREAPAGNVLVSEGWRTKGEVLPYVSAPVAAGGYNWYEILYNGVCYWVRGDCVQEVEGAAQTPETAAPANPAESGSPEIAPPAVTTGYVTTIINNVNLRLQPSGQAITQIPKNVMLAYERTIEPHTPGNDSKYTWYYVAYGELHGYVRSDCVTLNETSTVTQAPALTEQPPAVTAEPTVVSYGYVKMMSAGVNVRLTPGGKSQEQLEAGVVVVVTGPTSSASSYVWYPILTPSGKAGYVRGDCVAVCDASGVLLAENGQPLPEVTPTVAPTDTPVPTAAPTPESYGYVRITKNGTNIRSTMGGTVLFRANEGEVYPMWGPADNRNGTIWYPVLVNEKQAWVSSECATLVNSAGPNPSEPAAPNDTPDTLVESSYVVTVLNDVNLRKVASKDGAKVAQLELGTVLGYNGTTTTSGSLWYRVVYQNKEVWVLGSCVRIMLQSEYESWQAAHPNDVPAVKAIMGYVKTTADAVNLRDEADGKATGVRVNKDEVFIYVEKETVKSVNWYQVELSDGSRAWLNGKYVVETHKDGTPLVSSTPSTGSDGAYKPSTAGQEATYTTLQRGSTGTAVTALVTELKLQGYYTGTITSTYTEAVELAVKAFQTAKGIKADGVAGSDTQHALFQTVPVGQGGTNVDFTFYPAEKIDWFTGGIQQQWAKGATAKVYDVKTGVVWTAKRWSGFNHADVEPLTAADTARLCKIYGVKTAQQIWDDNHWQGRPILVLVGEHNYAASLMGMPHNYPAGDTIPNNDLDGQICIHFTNSKTSDSGIIKEDHVQAIEYAYTHAPGGQKK